MKIFPDIPTLKQNLASEREQARRIGLVPTMGFLHEGHLSLVRESVRQMDCTVASIFVNPAQFAPHEDFADYPRDPQKDLDMLDKAGTDYVFIPSVKQMYPEGYHTYVEVQHLQEQLCGRTRPHFFRGVCTVVLKLFNIVSPDVAFFGQKDAQQSIILKRMVRDLDLDVHIEVLPIIRDEDGLALSSRNSYFDAEQRKAALCLSRSLRLARAKISAGETDAARITQLIRAELDAEPKARIDYVEIVDTEELQPRQTVRPGDLIALAVFIDKVRLIDNMVVEG
jgi:pantoate--beta-alanine ligase